MMRRSGKICFCRAGRDATVQPAESVWHPAIENRFAMGRMPTGTTFSYGLCSKCTDLAESLRRDSIIKEKYDRTI